MNQLQVLGKQTVAGIEFTGIEGGFGEGKKAMLVKDVAEIHGQPLKEINRRIKDNRRRFKEGVDIIDCLSGFEPLRKIAKENGWVGSNRTRNVYLLSERGYAKLLKILEDDLAWELYDKLVDEYFQMRASQPQIAYVHLSQCVATAVTQSMVQIIPIIVDSINKQTTSAPIKEDTAESNVKAVKKVKRSDLVSNWKANVFLEEVNKALAVLYPTKPLNSLKGNARRNLLKELYEEVTRYFELTDGELQARQAKFKIKRKCEALTVDEMNHAYRFLKGKLEG